MSERTAVRVEAPIPAALAGELQEFWGDIFGHSADRPPDVAREVFLGSELDSHRLNRLLLSYRLSWNPFGVSPVILMNPLTVTRFGFSSARDT